MKKEQKKQGGFSVLELVLAVALFAVFATAIALAVMQGSGTQQKVVQAEISRQWARDGIEAARALRSQSFDSLQNTDGSGIRFEGGKWELYSNQDEWEGYTRVIQIQTARRDGNGNIVLEGGDEDVDLKRIFVTVTKGDISAEFSSYLSRREIVPIVP